MSNHPRTPSNKRHSGRDKCSYCGARLTTRSTLPPRSWDAAAQLRAASARTWDHIVPASCGGKITIPCCCWCNGKKGDRSLKDWLESDDLALRISMIAQRDPDAEPMHPKILQKLRDEDLTRIRRDLEYHATN